MEKHMGMSRRQFAVGAGMTALAGAAAVASSASTAWAEKAPTVDEVNWDVVCDVLVVGFGGAGATAAIEAADAGANVLLVDKAPEYLEGGNTRYCEQVILGWEDEQVGYDFVTAMADGHEDVTEDIRRMIASETVKNGDWVAAHGGEFADSPIKLDEETFKKVFTNIDERIKSNWVGQMSDGTWTFFEYCTWPNTDRLNDYQVSHYYGVVAPKHHKGYWEFLRKTVEDYSDKIACWFNSPATKLIRDRETGIVLGAVVDHAGTPTNVFARNGVVLASASYEADANKRQTYTGREGTKFVGSTFDTGDGIDMAAEVGAQLWHMNCLSGPFVNPPKPGSDQAWWCGGGLNRATDTGNSIFVTANGKRFMRECGMNHHGFMPVGDTYMNMQLPKKFFAVMDADGFATSQFHGKPTYVVVGMDNISQADTIEELAEKLGVDPEGLAQTVADYNTYCDQGFDADFARYPESLAKIENGPFYGIEYTGAFVNSQGGAKRDVNCQVLDWDGEPIAHLYEAGELGSFWGGVYIAGGNIGETMYSGRIAGANAAATKDDAVEEPAGAAAPANEITVFDADAIVASYECGENEHAGVALGIHAPIVVKVTLDGETVTAVEVLSQMESPDVVLDLFTDMPERMVEAGSADVDLQTGATIASRGLQDAVKDAMARAGVVIEG